MSLNNNNRLKNAFSELPTPLKFRSLVESGVKTNQLDPMILKTITKDDMPLFGNLTREFWELGRLYYEKMYLTQKLCVFDTREAWKDQTKMTLSALKLSLSYIEMLNDLNNKRLKYKEITTFYSERKQELLGLISRTGGILTNISNLLTRKPEFEEAFNENEEKIKSIEADLGFAFPHKDAFLQV